jgi:Protein of unknown function (DUF1269)
MANLLVLKFPQSDGAYRMLDKLEDLQKQEFIHIEDAAVVSWPEGKRKPRTRHMNNLAGIGALDGAFWGLLLGLIFFVPLLGMSRGGDRGPLGLLGQLRDRRGLHKQGQREGNRRHLGAVPTRERSDGGQDPRRGQGDGLRDHRHQPSQGSRGEAARGLRRVVELSVQERCAGRG